MRIGLHNSLGKNNVKTLLNEYIDLRGVSISCVRAFCYLNSAIFTGEKETFWIVKIVFSEGNVSMRSPKC